MSMTAVKERPILFSGPMVSAIRCDRKTQTRRIIKDQPQEKEGGRWGWIASSTEPKQRDCFAYSWPDSKGTCFTKRGRESQLLFRCPYGLSGDRLWVRETFRKYRIETGSGELRYDYRADDPSASGEGFIPWTPCIHMPRAASRISLDITGTRVERLQSITREDAIAEGIKQITSIGPCRAMGWKDYCGGVGFLNPIDSFRSLWVSINGVESWTANPWVFVVEFVRVK